MSTNQTVDEAAAAMDEWNDRMVATDDYVLFATLVNDPSPLHLKIEENAFLGNPPDEIKAKRRITWAVLEAVKRLDAQNRPVEFLVGSPDYDRDAAGGHYSVKGVVQNLRAVVLGRGGETFLVVQETDPAKLVVVFPAACVENITPVREVR